jgi:hypothetical protein
LGLDVDILKGCSANIRCDDSLADWILNGEDPTSRIAWTTQRIPRGLAQIAESRGMSPTDVNSGGLLGIVGQLLLPSRDPKASERAAAFRTFPHTWLNEGGYFDLLASASGAIASVQKDGAEVVLRRGRDCIELNFNGEVLQLLAVDLPALPIILDCLGLLGDSTEATSGSWNAGDLATLLSPSLDELSIDGIWWSLSRDVPIPDALWNIPENIQLATNSWELVGGSQGISEDDGTDYLLKIGPRYVVLTAEGETILDEDSDENAIQVFLRDRVRDESEDLIQATWVREDLDLRHGPVDHLSST